MEKLCKNCQYFMQASTVIMDYGWGHCKKPTRFAVMDAEKERGVFTWAEDFCSDFKPRQKPDNNPGSAPKGGGKFLKQDCGQFG